MANWGTLVTGVDELMELSHSDSQTEIHDLSTLDFISPDSTLQTRPEVARSNLRFWERFLKCHRVHRKHKGFLKTEL